MCEPPLAGRPFSHREFLSAAESFTASLQFGDAFVILGEGLVSLCQVNLFNIAAKYNKSHISDAPKGTTVITTVVALLEFGCAELKLCEAPRE